MNRHNTIVAVVAGSDHQNTLGIICSLGEQGICVKAVIVSDNGACATVQSKYIDEAMVVPAGELIPALVRMGKRIGSMVPLVPGGDDTAIPIAQAYEQLKDRYYLSGSGNGENTLRLMKKTEMLEAAKNAGLCVPKWVALQEDAYADLEQRCEELRFPCIMKPAGLKWGDSFNSGFSRPEKNCQPLWNISKKLRDSHHPGIHQCNC